MLTDSRSSVPVGREAFDRPSPGKAIRYLINIAEGAAGLLTVILLAGLALGHALSLTVVLSLLAWLAVAMLLRVALAVAVLTRMRRDKRFRKEVRDVTARTVL